MFSLPPNSRRASTHEDDSFLERTFAEQKAPLTRYATRLLNDADRARDVVQDTFLKLMAQRPEAIEPLQSEHPPLSIGAGSALTGIRWSRPHLKW